MSYKGFRSGQTSGRNYDGVNTPRGALGLPNGVTGTTGLGGIGAAMAKHSSPDRGQIDLLLGMLEGTRFYDVAKAAQKQYMKAGKLDLAAYDQYLLSLVATASDEQYSEDSIYRAADAQQRLGINTDLAGLGDADGGAAQQTPLPASPSAEEPMLGQSFLTGLESIGRIGISVGSLFSGAQSAVSAISSIVGANRQLVSGAVNEALGDIPSLVHDFSAEGLSDQDIKSRVLDVLFGVNGAPGKLAGYSGKVLSKARSFAESYLDSHLAGDVSKAGRATSTAGLHKSQLDARAAAHEDAVDEASGVHALEGALFRSQVRSAKKLAKIRVQTARAQANYERLCALYNEKYQGSLDADLAAFAQNSSNQFTIDHNQAQTEVDALEIQGQSLNNEGKRLSNEQQRMLNDINKAKSEIEMIQAASDKILAEAEYDAIQSCAESWDASWSGDDKRASYFGQRTNRDQKKLKDLREIDHHSPKSVRLSIPGIGSFGGNF